MPIYLRGRISGPLFVLGVIGLLFLAGCSSSEAAEAADVTRAPLPSVTPARFQPTITPIPPPTELPTIVFPTVTPTALPTPTPTRDPTIPNIIMSPNLGDLNQAVQITAFGFVPDSTVSLYWTQPGVPPGGPIFQQAQVGDDGTFGLSVNIPDQWPGGQPTELEFLELRVIGDENRQAWATYRYVVRFQSAVQLTLAYSNPVHGYTIDLPTGWQIQDADAANVRFGLAGSSQINFIQVIATADVNAAIDTLMGQLAPGESLTKEATTVGVESATRVTVDSSGQVYWFVGHAGQTFALYFPEAALAIGSFRF